LTRQLLHQEPEAYPCRGGINFFFIDAKTGSTYPCGYRDKTDMGSFEELNLSDMLKGSRDCRVRPAIKSIENRDAAIAEQTVNMNYEIYSLCKM